MGLSNDIISEFAKLATSDKKTNTETTLNGTVVDYDGKQFVRIDGSDLLTPVNRTTSIKDGERVMVMIKNHTATVIGNTSSPSPSSSDLSDVVDQITEVEILVADKVSTNDFDAQVGRIDTLFSDNVIIKDTVTANNALVNEIKAENVVITNKLTATEASIDDLNINKLDANIASITYATIANLDATNADLYNLEATYAEFEDTTTRRLDAVEANLDNLDATYATIDELDAERARIDVIEVGQMGADSAFIKELRADMAEINTLIFGSAAGGVIHSSFSNAVIAQLGDAQIKSAMIESISADKIAAGDIITNNVRVMSEDGKLLISDETLQINDMNRTRVQLGKDANNDYSINIWDADGNLMFSEGGISDNAIKDAIIRDDMVSNTANISAHKLNIDSLFEEINGSKHTISSSRIYMSETQQTLDVEFERMITDLEEAQNGFISQGTAINVIQGQITNKVWQQDIDDAKTELSTQYSELQQTTDGLTSRVVVIESDMATGDDISAIQSNIEGTETRVSTTESLIQQLTNSISMLVTDGNGQSLMTQTENGWTFSTENIQSLVNSTSESLASLIDEVGDVTSTVDVLQQTVTDIGVLTDYVKIGTYENEPCIELGESDSDFKLVITNTRIMFMEGSGVPAYINNQSLFIKKAVIEEELQHGSFVWKARANGNLGLVWKGAAS